MTETEYREKLLCFWCSYGTKVAEFLIDLRLGSYCAEKEYDLYKLRSMIDKFATYDVRDLPDFTEVYNTLTEEDFYLLITEIEKLI